MEPKEVLKQIHFSENEAEIYLACLALGNCTASEIAQKSGIQRTHAYDILKKLIEKGIIQKTKKANKTLFFAVEPKELLAHQEQKTDTLKQSLHVFDSLKNSSNQKPHVFYYEGRLGINQINEDTLLQEGEIVGFTTPKFLLLNGTKFSSDYIKKRIQKRIRVRAIGEMSSEMIGIKKRDKEELRQTKLLPNTIFNSDVEIGIYGKKVFIIDYEKEFGLTIESAKIQHTLKQLFEIIWDSGKIID